MKKTWKIVLIVIAVFLVIGLIGSCFNLGQEKTDTATSEPTPTPTAQPELDITAFADKQNATIGKFENGYAVPGGGGAYNVISVKKSPDYVFDDSQNYHNAVVIEVATSEDLTKQLVKNGAFSVSDNTGKEYTNFNIDVGNIDRYCYIIFSGNDLENQDTFDNAKFITIKGMDENKNDGKRNIVFDIASE